MSYIEKYPWVIHFDGSGCSGCSMEAQVCYSPRYDLEQYGIRKTGNPRHADVLLITGIIEEECADKLKMIYDRMCEPKAVVAIGDCACLGGMFCECASSLDGAGEVVPVDVYVSGCAVHPEEIINGILQSFAPTEEMIEDADDEESTPDEKEEEDE